MIPSVTLANHRNRGFSLVELLIATTVGLILISGMIAVFSGNKRSSELNQAMSDMQENARFALDAIGRDARMSGFQGCVDINNAAATNQALNAPAYATVYDTVSTGSVVTSATTWNPVPIPTFTIPLTAAQPVPGTHALTLQFGSPITRPLAADMTTRNSVIAVPNNPWNIGANELMIIGNCDYADLFRTTAVATAGSTVQISHAATGNASGSLTNRYAQSDTMVMRFLSNIYYIGQSGQTNEDGDAITSLYRQSLPYSRQPTELIQGVENMRVKFGIRNDQNVLRYVSPADATFEPGRVESIQIGLLLVSWDSISQNADNQTYILAGDAIAPAENPVDASSHPIDQRYRLAFNTTIKVRNRR